MDKTKSCFVAQASGHQSEGAERRSKMNSRPQHLFVEFKFSGKMGMSVLFLSKNS